MVVMKSGFFFSLLLNVCEKLATWRIILTLSSVAVGTSNTFVYERSVAKVHTRVFNLPALKKIN